jgi:hypothetical protein
MHLKQIGRRGRGGGHCDTVKQKKMQLLSSLASQNLMVSLLYHELCGLGNENERRQSQNFCLRGSFKYRRLQS